MRIKSLYLRNFRNYEEQQLDFCQGVNVIYGNNAQGKTNILEAINLFSCGRSHRAIKEREMIRFGENKGSAAIIFEGYERENTASIILSMEKRKELFLNGVKIGKMERLVGYFHCVLFCPDDLTMIKGMPSQRRKFLDMSISQLKPGYFQALVQYRKLMEHKARMLKNQDFSEMYPVFCEKMAEMGAKIMVYRKSYCDKLFLYAQKIHEEITEGKEKLEIQYMPTFEADDYTNSKLLSEQFIMIQKENDEKERNMRQSIIGPHRDDLVFLINGKNVKHFGSQGQQRTVVLTLKMAHLEMIRHYCGENPVLLLDDILSELDLSRQKYLLDKIEGRQVIITCTNRKGIPDSENKKFFHIQNGRVG